MYECMMLEDAKELLTKQDKDRMRGSLPDGVLVDLLDMKATVLSGFGTGAADVVLKMMGITAGQPKFHHLLTLAALDNR